MNEILRLSIRQAGPQGGTFSFYTEGLRTRELAFNAAPDEIQTALGDLLRRVRRKRWRALGLRRFCYSSYWLFLLHLDGPKVFVNPWDCE